MQNRDAGKAALEFLLQEVDFWVNRDFIIRVAFEYHDEAIIARVAKELLSNRALRLEEKKSLAAHLYVMNTSTESVLVSLQCEISNTLKCLCKGHACL